MRKRMCGVVLLALVCAASILQAQTSLLDPAGFTSLSGYFNPGGNVTVNMGTNQMLVSGGSTYTGVVSGSTLVFTFDSVTIGSGIAVSFTGVTSLGNKFALLSKGKMDVAGIINANADTSWPGPGGGVGAAGAGYIYSNGAGPGGGYGDSSAAGGCSGGGAFGGNGGIGNGQANQALAYGDLSTTFQGGSGGGKGYYADSGYAGGGGGGIELGARSSSLILQSTCRIYAYGANGMNSNSNGWDGMGGGSGGGILIHAYNVSIASGAVLNANGGIGGYGLTEGYGAGGGGGGRVSVYYHASGTGTNAGTITVAGGAGGAGGTGGTPPGQAATAGSAGVSVFASSTSSALGGLPPSAPTATAATGIQQASFIANWGAASGATGYCLDVATDSLFTSFVTGYNNLDDGNVTLDTINIGIAAGTTYYYRVRAYNANGTSGNSNRISVITIPPNPVATAASAIAEHNFTANWGTATGATKFYLDAATDSSFTTIVAGYQDLDVGLVTSYGITGLNYSTPYYYRVRAYNPSGISGNSNTISATTLDNQGPVIVMKTQPTSPQTIAGPYLIQAVITDPAKKTVKNIITDSLYYRVNGGGWAGVGNISVIGDTFDFQIPAIDTGRVEYYLQAWDNVGATTMEPLATYYSFFIDTIPPTIIWTSPADGDNDIGLNVNVIIAFSKPMDTTSIQIVDTPPLTNVTQEWSSTLDTMRTLSHDPFAYNTTYTLRFTAGKDTFGNDLAVLPDSFVFTTVANEAPGIEVTQQPADDYIGNGPFEVRARVYDLTKAGVAAESLYYAYTGDTANWYAVGGELVNSDTFRFMINDTFAAGTVVEYYLGAWDNTGAASYAANPNDMPYQLRILNVLAPSGLAAQGGLDASVPLTWAPPVQELSYYGDISTTWTSYSGWGYAGCIFDTRFSPIHYPCKLEQVTSAWRIYASGQTDTIIMHVWPDNGYGIPDTNNNLITPYKWVPGANWTGNTIDISSSNVIINSGDFHVGFVTTAIDSPRPRADIFNQAQTRSIYMWAGDGNWYSDVDNWLHIVSVSNVQSTKGGLNLASASGNIIKQGTSGILSAKEANKAKLPVSLSKMMTGYEILRGNTSGGPYGSLSYNADTTYVDNSVMNDSTYYYVVRATYHRATTADTFSAYSNQASATPLGVEGQPGAQVCSYYLKPASPNPVKYSAEFRFGLAKEGQASLGIYNVLGQKVQTLVSGRLAAGNHSVKWNGCDQNGRKVSSGIYVYRLTAGDNSFTRRFTVIR